jgi:cytidine diphosphoramidate kinase
MNSSTNTFKKKINTPCNERSSCYWVTGLSATGKTTLSKMLVESLRSSGKTVIYLDGDELREVLSDNAYTREERIALGMRYSRLCKLLTSQGVDVVIAVIGLFKELHEWNRKNILNYIEVFIETPLSELKKRDPKDLYKNYDLGKIKNVAGVDLQVDFPSQSDIHLQWTENKTVEVMFDELTDKMSSIIL